MLLSFTGIGTDWWIEIFDHISDTELADLKVQILAYVEQFNQLYSRFLPDSLITRLNEQGYLETPPADLVRFLKLAEQAGASTDWEFNVCVGGVMENLGYDANYSFQRSAAMLPTLIASGFQELTARRLQLLTGAKVDLGSFGKGWLIDELSDLLRQGGYSYFTINGGGDIYGTSDNGEQVNFLLENPLNIKEAVGEIGLCNAALACSAGNRRAWRDSVSGAQVNHIVKATTGEVNTELAGVFTYVADTNNYPALLADLAATALFVCAPDKLAVVANLINVDYALILNTGEYLTSKNYPGKFFN